MDFICLRAHNLRSCRYCRAFPRHLNGWRMRFVTAFICCGTVALLRNVIRQIAHPANAATPCCFRVAGLVVICASQAAAESPARDTTTLADVRIETDGGPILVPVRVRSPAAQRDDVDQVLKMLLDTGSDRTCFDLGHRGMLGRSVARFPASPGSGIDGVDAFACPTMRVGELRLHSAMPVACIDLKWLNDGIGEHVDGLLGTDLLREFAVAIDFDDGHLLFQRPASQPHGGDIRIFWKGRRGAERPYVEASFDGENTLLFLIDTGGISNVSAVLRADIHARLFEQGILTPAVAQEPALGRGTILERGGATLLRFAQARCLWVGGCRTRDVIVAPHPRVCALSLAYLSRYHVMLDFSNSVMRLRPGKSFSRRDVCYDLTSFGVRRDNGVVIDWTAENGWGALAGIKAGDRLLKVNGRSTKDLSIFAIRRMLAVESQQTLEIERGDAFQKIVLDLRREVDRILPRSIEAKPTEGN